MKELRVESYIELKSVLTDLSANPDIFILFSGSKDENGDSWCPDCVKAEPVVQKVIESTLRESDAVFIHCNVGERSSWKDAKNEFRTDPDLLLTAIPTMLKWKSVCVPSEYNNCPPEVKCCTRVWHPNIAEEGAVCLSILRSNSLDGTGWLPTRRLKDVIWGLNSLFWDLVDFDDPLNVDAANQYKKSPREFQKKVKDYIEKFCIREE